MTIKYSFDEDCKSCSSLSKRIPGVCLESMNSTPNCPCKKCLVKPTCNIDKEKDCEKFQMHFQYYMRSPV